ncbi:MAG: LD-carboxypeptidase [Acidobacteriota bacterium]
MQKVRPLEKGSTIGVVAPASDMSPEDLQKGVAELEHLGYSVRYSEAVFGRDLYFAGPHERRAEDLMQMFESPEISAIFCARGGYGCHHLLPLLDQHRIRRNPKIFMGYSDVTALLQYLEARAEMVCFHGPMVAREFAGGKALYDVDNLMRCLSDPSPGQRITGPGVETLRGGRAQGRLTGGCLSLLTALVGTPYEATTEDTILLLEDVGTKPYQLDRMLMHMRLAGKLQSVRGIVFGQMPNCAQSPEQDYRLQDVLLRALGPSSIPVLYGFPSGHTTAGALTLPMGVRVTLDADGGYLEVEEPPLV